MHVSVNHMTIHLDQIFGPACTQDTAASVTHSVSPILAHFPAVCVGSGVNHQL